MDFIDADGIEIGSPEPATMAHALQERALAARTPREFRDLFHDLVHVTVAACDRIRALEAEVAELRSSR